MEAIRTSSSVRLVATARARSSIAEFLALLDELRARGEPWATAFDNRIRIAINQDVAEPGAAVNDGDEVAFFPPVTGGGR